MSIILSNREIQILDLLSRGLTTKEIANNLYISFHTVESHRRNLLSKTGAKNVAGMIRVGFEVGVLYTLNSFQDLKNPVHPIKAFQL